MSGQKLKTETLKAESGGLVSIEVQFHQPFLAVAHAPIPNDTRVGISTRGGVFVPAKLLSISDGDALGGGRDLSVPVVIVKETVFVELDHAARILPNDLAQELLRALKQALLWRLQR